jgi:hypothetical protein
VEFLLLLGDGFQHNLVRFLLLQRRSWLIQWHAATAMKYALRAPFMVYSRHSARNLQLIKAGVGRV